MRLRIRADHLLILMHEVRCAEALTKKQVRELYGISEQQAKAIVRGLTQRDPRAGLVIKRKEVEGDG